MFIYKNSVLKRILKYLAIIFFFSLALYSFVYITYNIGIIRAVTKVNYNKVTFNDHSPIYDDEHIAIEDNKLEKLLNCTNRQLQREQYLDGNHWIIKNFVVGKVSKKLRCADTITYTTIADYTFFDVLPMLIRRWMGPISFAVFAPGYDFVDTLDSIYYLRNCLTESNLIQDYVSFHIYFPLNHMPRKIPLTEADALKWVPQRGNCANWTLAPYEHLNRQLTYKTLNNLTFPINVGRNIARRSVNTHFILACDIELLPSVGLIEQFLHMAATNLSIIYNEDRTSLRIFILPVFELEKNATIPSTKPELAELINNKMAFTFHAKLCLMCHQIPQENQWFNKTCDIQNINNECNEMSVFTTIKRQKKYRYWEPFYISDNREPYFDDRVTWEGQSNKRIQNYAMCLLDYEYHILHPGFLVHRPGIKKLNIKDPRLKYVPQMNKLIRDVIEPEYQILYGRRNACRT